MGLFSWFSWQLERRVMMKEMDRLRADLAEAERQLFYAKRDNVKVRRPVSELTSVIESAEPAETSETELEQLAREIYIYTADMSGDLCSPADAFEMANGFIKYRNRKREESNNNGPF